MTLEERIAKLEAIVKSNQIVLVDAQNPNDELILKFNAGNFDCIKRTTVVQETNLNLTSIETNN